MATGFVALRRAAAVAAAAGAAALLSCGGREGPSVLLVTVDTLRSDRLGCYGASGVRTPALDRLGSEGVLFADCFANVPSTGPSHASILTGLYPPRHGVRENAMSLPATIPLLSEELRAAGFTTAAFVSGFPLERRFGFARGFDHYDDRLPDGFTTENGKVRGTERIAEKTIDAFLRWLPGTEGRFFAWVHLFDPHAVYAAPRPFRRMYYRGSERDPANRSLEGVALPAYQMLGGVTDVRFPIALYEGEVTYTDHHLGRLLAALDSSARRERTIVLVVGDHGESMTEHGYYFGHSHFLYEPSLRVPLLIRWPGRVPEGTIVSDPVSLIDIAPTLRELLAMPEAPGDGRSLAALWSGRSRAPAPVFLERPLLEGSGLWGVRDGLWKYVLSEDGSEELYRLDGDPGETVNRAAAEKAEATRLREELERWRSSAPEAGAPALDEETRERLRALGYLP